MIGCRKFLEGLSMTNTLHTPSDYTLSQTKRFAISVENYAELMPVDTPAWLWDGEAHSLGLDAWREITGVDFQRNGNALLWIGSADIEVPKSTIIYVSIKSVGGANQ
jgi:hypothetical protein